MRRRISINVDIKTQITRIEKRVREAGHPVAELLRRADVDASQWVRWKQGKQAPLLSTWSKITKAADKMAPVQRSGKAA